MKDNYVLICDRYIEDRKDMPLYKYINKEEWVRSHRHWFKLSERQLNRLKHLVKERDKALRVTYETYMKVDVPDQDWDAAEVHHVAHRGSGGDDKPNNLVSVSFRVHRFYFHADDPETVDFWTKRAIGYLESPEVKAWEEEHAEELAEIYGKSEAAHIRKKRKGCIPKKPKWARF